MLKKKVNIKKNFMLFLLIFSLAITTIAVLIGFLKNASEKAVIPISTTSEIDESGEPTDETQSKDEPEKSPSTIKILGVGDNLIHSGLYLQAKRRATDGGYNFISPYDEVRDIITAADIATVNQESVMASIFEPSGYPLFNSPTEVGDALIDIGFDVFNFANNHVLDKGVKGINSTFEYLKTKPDIKTVGLYENVADFSEPRVIEKNDIKVGFVGLTAHTNGLSLPSKSDIVIPKTADKEQIKAQIAAAKAVSDVVVVNIHWGEEYTHSPNAIQKDLAQFMIENGADIIYGHHPHVIQPVEYITRSDGTKGIVCYSLGNFISAQDYSPRVLGGALEVSITKEFQNNTVSITNAEYTPIVTQYERNFSNIRNYPFSKYTKELAAAHGVPYGQKFSYEFLENTINTVIDKQFLK